ncbi:hypothetical protein Tco_0956201 [Tanacetum coccineum]|uniref:E3 UFM1-protein ligase 1-like domain-containing protein n=1 Tax=Tanacetum coccineum TaxID=301880 RepID=A0ABQ5E9F5_9ASTR
MERGSLRYGIAVRYFLKSDHRFGVIGNDDWNDDGNDSVRDPRRSRLLPYRDWEYAYQIENRQGFGDPCDYVKKITELVPDFEDQGVDPETVIVPLATHLRPMLLNAWNERRKVAFMDNTQKNKRVLDNLEKKLDELYEKGLDLFDDNPSTSTLLHRHLLKTTAAPMVDMLLSNMDMLIMLKNGIDVQDVNDAESVSLTSGDRIALAKKFDGPLSLKANAVVEALEGKAALL